MIKSVKENMKGYFEDKGKKEFLRMTETQTTRQKN